MRYTTLRVGEEGVVLFAQHARRLAPEGEEALEAFERFAVQATPGVYSVLADGGRLQVEARTSRMRDGMPVRWMRSPFHATAGPFAKPAPPSLYDAVRAPGVATLLTSADGTELLESCSAAVVGWDGERFVLVPDDRPRVVSVAEMALRQTLAPGFARLLVADSMPLVLLNAVKGPCRIALPGRAPFPEAALALLEGLVHASGT